MTESALSDEADALYRPLAGLDRWASASASAAALAAVPAAVPGIDWPDDPAWTAMLRRGALLAAAHESAALDEMFPGDRPLAMSLLAGVSSLADVVGDERRSHVQANYEALLVAAAARDDDLASEAWLRRVHAVACRPQRTHPVRTDLGVQDHVLAAGDYKHHPNHVRTAGGWAAHAPVRVLRDEMARFSAAVAGPDFAALSPIARAAYTLHALTHVAPFADGNGRLARAVASGHLSRTMSLPFLVFADEAGGYEAALAAGPEGLVDFVGESAARLVQILAGLHAGPSPERVAALDRWRHRSDAAATLALALPDAVEQALTRHRRRTDLGWLAPLTDASVEPPSPDRPSSLRVGVRPRGVDEELAVDGHPLVDDGVIVVHAAQAQLRITAAPEDLVPAVSPAFAAALARWLDRVVSTLALRVAAETEPN